MKTYLVGGAVRDKLLGKTASDLDYVVVGATEQDMLDAGFKNVGAAFPVFLHPETGDEYALARKERKTGPGYLGFAVEYDPTVTIEEDLSRRDLTINSIAIDETTGEIIDPFNGQADIHYKVLRHTSEAFAEDPLRVVRLARFASRYVDFTVAPETAVMAQKVVASGEMNFLSDERYLAELDKMFASAKSVSRFFSLMTDFGVMDKVIFFRDMFGTIKDWKYSIFSAVMNDIPEEDRTMIFVGLTANYDAKQTSDAIPTRIKKLTSNMLFIKSVIMDARGIYDLISMNRSWHDRLLLADVLSTLSVSDKQQEAMRILYRITLAFDAAVSVTAEKFMHLKGPEIGKALAAERFEVIKEALGE